MKIIVKYAIQKKKCHWLSLKNNQITSHGLSILADGLTDNRSLQSLYLTQNLIEDLGVQYLTKILGNTYCNLTFLALDNNRIEDRGAQYLAEMLKTNETLTDLWLSYNSIGNIGVKSLAAVLCSTNRTLMQLYLHGNKLINDLVVSDLIVMLELNQSLNTLWLQDCNITKEGNGKLENTIQFREDFDLYV
jgi:Ran GTPase-activating protein (RanGAP) involved in mRNA processing and transport